MLQAVWVPLQQRCSRLLGPRGLASEPVCRQRPFSQGVLRGMGPRLCPPCLLVGEAAGHAWGSLGGSASRAPPEARVSREQGGPRFWEPAWGAKEGRGAGSPKSSWMCV